MRTSRARPTAVRSPTCSCASWAARTRASRPTDWQWPPAARLPAAMRAVVIEKTGDPDTLALRDVPEPSLTPGRVLVRVRAAGINFADLMARMGLYPDAPELPAVLGYEVAGEVERVGDDVEEFGVGDKVVGWVRFGGYAEIVAARERDLV